MIHQVVFDTSKIISEHGIETVVLSPGSRNAPLTVSFARNKDLRIFNIVDERSAGFIALGIAQKTQKPVVLCCTSGTALLNYAPAIAEAFYQRVPLIVISADRPSEWQGQRDGQTIEQIGALRNFVLGEFQMPIPINDDTSWEYSRKLNEAINLSQGLVSGPVHINIPFREPFYPDADQTLEFSSSIHIIKSNIGSIDANTDNHVSVLAKCNKVLVIVGQQAWDASFDELLERLKGKAVIIADVISNVKNAHINHHDYFLAHLSKDQKDRLQPELLITIGKSVISKSLKQFLRVHKSTAHWHIEENIPLADTFQSITEQIFCNPKSWLKSLVSQSHSSTEVEQSKDYIKQWLFLESQAIEGMKRLIDNLDFSEYVAFVKVMQNLPDRIDLHLANSMPVRFANMIGDVSKDVEVFSNRGTSGIDGTNGTAVGNALVSDKITYLLTGDLSFFYDRNAFFHNYPLDNLKIIVFNNLGGGIFRLIPGPSSLAELTQHFETRHHHSAEFMAKEFGFNYQVANNESEIIDSMKRIKESHKPQILEIFTDPETNSREFSRIKEMMQDQISRSVS